MPSLTTTIEDTSPLIVYSGNDWQTGSSNGDIYAEQYVFCESKLELADYYLSLLASDIRKAVIW